jgi:hypothetical protein
MDLVFYPKTILNLNTREMCPFFKQSYFDQNQLVFALKSNDRNHNLR